MDSIIAEAGSEAQRPSSVRHTIIPDLRPEVDWSAWPMLNPEEIHALTQVAIEEANGRWCAVGAHLSYLSERQGTFRTKVGAWLVDHIGQIARRRRDQLARYGLEWPKLTRNEVIGLNLLDMYEERGDWAGVRYCLEAVPVHLREIDPKLAEHIDRAWEHLQAAEQVEAQLGTGSLRDEKHPWILRMRQIKTRQSALA